ncbi:hypothetical protein BJX96DRAFT_47754 [Aspergillus floccosus]
MERERKAPSPEPTPSAYNRRNKKWKSHYTIPSSDDEDDQTSSSLGEDEWLINSILDETDSQYLIDWEGPWTPTWVGISTVHRL